MPLFSLSYYYLLHYFGTLHSVLGFFFFERLPTVMDNYTLAAK